MGTVAETATLDDHTKILRRRLRVKDEITQIEFLVDTGSDVSALPRSMYPECELDNTTRLFAVNGTPITTYGTIDFVTTLPCKTTFKFTYIIADVSNPILGLDFLDKFDFLVDIRQK